MEDKENQIPEAGQKDAGRPKRRLHPKGYYHGVVDFSKPLYLLGAPTSLRESLPEEPEKLRRKYKPAENLFVFTAKPKQKSTRKPACTLMWGAEEDDDALLQ